MRIFGGERMQNLMLRLGMEEDVPIESKLITKRIASAQKAVEAQNFAARKHILEYDDVMNTQRVKIYEQRRQVLDGEDLSDEIRIWIEEVVATNVANTTESEYSEEWDLDTLVAQMQALYGTDITVDELREEEVDVKR